MSLVSSLVLLFLTHVLTLGLGPGPAQPDVVSDAQSLLGVDFPGPG